jgi:hypothetical protein
MRNIEVNRRMCRVRATRATRHMNSRSIANRSDSSRNPTSSNSRRFQNAGGWGRTFPSNGSIGYQTRV